MNEQQNRPVERWAGIETRLNWYHGNPGEEAHEQIALEYRQRLADIDLNSFGANEEHRRYYCGLQRR